MSSGNSAMVMKLTVWSRRLRHQRHERLHYDPARAVARPPAHVEAVPLEHVAAIATRPAASGHPQRAQDHDSARASALRLEPKI
jgi:hypothetical protein